MQRELRFRTWFQDQMTYLEQSIGQYDYENGIVLSFSDEGYDEFGAHERFDVSQSNPPPMMQWTGLRDKNGKEIYEGDVLKHDLDIKFTSRVEFINGQFVRHINEYELRNQLFPFHSSLYGSNIMVDFEVIGNIYENPDILKSE